MAFSFLKPRLFSSYRDLALLLFKYARSDIFDVGALYSIVEADEVQQEGAKPEEMARDLEKMGPTFVKLGQVLSGRPDLVAPAYLEALARLQDDVEPVPTEKIREVLQRELGTRPDRLFAWFDDKPLAAASLGQVHRARLRGEEREVVVKIQRPGIRDRIAKDLEALEAIAEMMDEHLEAGATVGFSDLLRQFRQTLATELDYRVEARNLVLFARNLEELESLVIPQPVMDLSTERVLTMDFIAGVRLDDLHPVALIDVDGTELARDLIEAYLKQILVDGVFHADPHQGNVYLTRDHRIALIDFGMVGYLNEDSQEKFLALVLALAENQAAEVAERAIEIAADGSKPDKEQFRREITTLMGRNSTASLGQLEVGRLLLELYKIAAACGLRVPPEISMLGKTLGQLEEIVGQLAPKLDTAEVIRDKAGELTARALASDLSPRKLLSNALDMKRFLAELPGDVRKVLNRLSEGDFRLNLDYQGTDRVTVALQEASNRLSAAIVIAALVVGAALLMRVETSFRILGYPGIAILLFILAAGCGLWLLWKIFRTGLGSERQGSER